MRDSSPPLVTIACPRCRHDVPVTMRTVTARCMACGHEWKWKKESKLVRFAMQENPRHERACS